MASCSGSEDRKIRWKKSFILHPSMSVPQSKGLERIYLVCVGIEWNFNIFSYASCVFHESFISMSDGQCSGGGNTCWRRSAYPGSLVDVASFVSVLNSLDITANWWKCWSVRAFWTVDFSLNVCHFYFELMKWFLPQDLSFPILELLGSFKLNYFAFCDEHESVGKWKKTVDYQQRLKVPFEVF